MSWGDWIQRIGLVLVGLLLIPIILCGGFMLADKVISTQAMRPVAERLGTEPHIGAINDYVAQALDEHLGASQDDIHTILAEIGDFEYRPHEPRPHLGEGARENAWWTIGDILWWNYHSGWTLVYDLDGRLMEVMRIDI